MAGEENNQCVMRNSRLSWISLVISIVALVVSIIVLVNYCPTQGLSFDYMGVIVGILSLLVTALIGAQVGQYVFVDKKIEKIASTITRTIAKKAAQDEARRIAVQVAEDMAKKTAMKVVGGLPDDIAYVHRGKDWMQKAVTEIMVSEYMTAIDNVFDALREFKKCGADVLYQSTIDDALDTLKNYFEWSKERGGVRVLKGKKETYQTVLRDLRSEKVKVCLDYLMQAKELDKDEDNRISTKEIEDMFKV